MEFKTSPTVYFNSKPTYQWKFNDINGSIVVETNNILTGSIIGDMSYVPGKIGNAISSGSPAYISTPNDSSFNNLSGITLSFWINPHISISGTALQDAAQFIYKYGFTQVWYYEPTNLVVFDVYSGATRKFMDNPVGELKVGPGEWNHLAFTYDSNTGSSIAYSNGSLTRRFNTGKFLLIDNGSPWQLCAGGGEPPIRYYSGLTDDMRVYNRALSQSEIKQLYNWGDGRETFIEGDGYSFQSESSNISLQNKNSSLELKHDSEFITQRSNEISGCVICFSFNESTGSWTFDSITGISGAVSGTTPPTFVDGRYNNGLNFTGSGQVRVGSPHPFAFNGSQDFSYSYWINPQPHGNYTARVLEPGVVNYPYVLRDQSGTLMEHYWSKFDGVSNPTVSTGKIISLGVWSHIAGKYVNSTRQMYIYLNGDLMASGTDNTNLNNIGTAYSQAIIGNTSDMLRSYIGKLDELALFSRALSETEIQQIYQNGYPKFIELKNENKNITLAEV